MAVKKDTPRQVAVKVTYSKKVKSKKAGRTRERPAAVMAEYNEGFTYTDPASGESDTISITLTNTDMRWAKKWIPGKGDKLKAEIIEKSWDKAGQKKTFFCGKFCLDDISYSGPELTCTIGGVSVPDCNALRSTQRSRTWKKAALKEVASEIAKRYHLKLDYTGGTVALGTVEQNNETDSSFLKKCCEDYGMGIKVFCGKIVVYDKAEFEAKKPAVTIKKADLQRWSYNTTITGTYTGASIKYTSGRDDKEIKCVVGSGKRILNINEKAESLKEAQLKACAKVNSENEKAATMTATIMADIRIAAGCTVKIAGLGHISGKYFVDQVTHNIEADSGYTMDLEMHRCQRRISQVSSVKVLESREKTATNTRAKKTPNKTKKEETGFNAGDKVLVNGNAYWGGNGGSTEQYENAQMYITQVLGSSYKYRYGITRRKGGARLGWCAEDSIKKA